GVALRPADVRATRAVGGAADLTVVLGAAHRQPRGSPAGRVAARSREAHEPELSIEVDPSHDQESVARGHRAVTPRTAWRHAHAVGRPAGGDGAGGSDVLNEHIRESVERGLPDDDEGPA